MPPLSRLLITTMWILGAKGVEEPEGLPQPGCKASEKMGWRVGAGPRVIPIGVHLASRGNIRTGQGQVRQPK